MKVSNHQVIMLFLIAKDSLSRDFTMGGLNRTNRTKFLNDILSQQDTDVREFDKEKALKEEKSPNAHVAAFFAALGEIIEELGMPEESSWEDVMEEIKKLKG